VETARAPAGTGAQVTLAVRDVADGRRTANALMPGAMMLGSRERWRCGAPMPSRAARAVCHRCRTRWTAAAYNNPALIRNRFGADNFGR